MTALHLFSVSAAGIVAAASMLTAIAPVRADSAALGSESSLDTITITATGVSNMSAASAGDVSQEQLAGQPLLRPGAVIENVPGLIAPSTRAKDATWRPGGYWTPHLWSGHGPLCRGRDLTTICRRTTRIEGIRFLHSVVDDMH